MMYYYFMEPIRRFRNSLLRRINKMQNVQSLEELIGNDEPTLLMDKSGDEFPYFPLSLPGSLHEIYIRVEDGKAILDFETLRMIFNDADGEIEDAVMKNKAVREEGRRLGFAEGVASITKAPALAGGAL
jgi:hypothetical protein